MQNFDEEKYLMLKEFISYAKRYDLTNEIKEKTIEIRRSISLKTPDAIIAATAMVYNCVLVTRNVNDFQKIVNLEFFNPFN